MAEKFGVVIWNVGDVATALVKTKYDRAKSCDAPEAGSHNQPADPRIRRVRFPERVNTQDVPRP